MSSESWPVCLCCNKENDSVLIVEGLAKTLRAAKCLMKLLNICVKGTTGIINSFPSFVPAVGKIH